jgi:hypothetical protein
MKLTEKILRAPLPDQLKALLEKFDTEFDASHLRKLAALADEQSLTWYERRMLTRAHRKAQMELNRADTLDLAMSIVLNREEEKTQYVPAEYGSSISIAGTDLYKRQLEQQAQIVKSDLQRALMGTPR